MIILKQAQESINYTRRNIERDDTEIKAEGTTDGFDCIIKGGTNDSNRKGNQGKPEAPYNQNKEKNEGSTKPEKDRNPGGGWEWWVETYSSGCVHKNSGKER